MLYVGGSRSGPGFWEPTELGKKMEGREECHRQPAILPRQPSYFTGDEKPMKGFEMRDVHFRKLIFPTVLESRSEKHMGAVKETLQEAAERIWKEVNVQMGLMVEDMQGRGKKY